MVINEFEDFCHSAKDDDVYLMMESTSSLDINDIILDITLFTENLVEITL